MASPAHTPSLDIQPHEHTYTHLAAAWTRGSVVRIMIAGAPLPIEVPLAFLEGSGNNTWEMVLHMLHAIVNERGELVSAGGGASLDPQAEPVQGDYNFVPLDEQYFTWTRGPQGSRKGRAAGVGESDEDTSNSAAFPVQSFFREYILGRDCCCLLSGTGFAGCHAAHLVPKARTDIYGSLLDEPEIFIDPYHLSMGILLRSDLHKHYDMYDWSLFVKDGIYHVHVFDGLKYLERYHGKQITAADFHPRASKEDYPDPVLCNWHYMQCCMMHLRGFSAGMAVNAY